MPARNRVPKASENVQAMGRHGKNMKKKKMIILILCHGTDSGGGREAGGNPDSGISENHGSCR